MIVKKIIFCLVFIACFFGVFAPKKQAGKPQLAKTAFSLPAPDSKADGTLSKVWVPDNGDGTYKNPILNADYSDPDAIRVGDDFFLVASSFNCAPGIPVLHSKDLVNWSIINHVFTRQVPFDLFEKPLHENGVWAPAIRFHNGEFYIYYPDPNLGIYMVKAKNPAEKWSDPILVKAGRGFIDPCPLWDDNGNVYLVHAYAGSRAGIKSILMVTRMSSDGTKVIDDGNIVFDGHDNHETLEGPKFYKRNGYYYIMAPAGGISGGYQLVLRSKNIYGPYDEKIVLEQGSTNINGPHQGGWVETQTGESWFLNFQDKGAYGRVVHLQPVKWVNDWPVMGIDKDGDGKGEPVTTYKKPNVGKTWPIATPATSDEFNGLTYGKQWQWQANYKPWWAYTIASKGILRMYAINQPENFVNFWDAPALFLQKFTAPEFKATSKLTFRPTQATRTGEKCGLIVMGRDYAYVSIKKQEGKLYLSYTTCSNASARGAEKESELIPIETNTVFFKVAVSKGAICNFSYSTDGNAFTPIGTALTATTGRWIGAKVGLFCMRPTFINDPGFVDVDWFRVE